MSDGATAYVSLWEYRVRPGREADFERLYGPEGDVGDYEPPAIRTR